MVTIEVKRTLDFYDLQNDCWSGAEDTLKTIEEYGMEEEFMDFLVSYYGDEIPTMTEVNDLLWFESDWIFEQIGLEEESEEDWEEEDEGEE